MTKNLKLKRIEYRVILMKTNKRSINTRSFSLLIICLMSNTKFIIDRFYKFFVFYLNIDRFKTI